MLKRIHRCQWDLPRDHEGAFAVYSHGLNENMAPGLERRLSGDDDWLFVFFYDKVEIDIGHGLQPVASNSLVIWPPRIPLIYGSGTDEWRHSWIHVAGREVAPMVSGCGFAPLAPVCVPDAGLTEVYLLQIFQEISLHQEPDGRVLRNFFENWLVEMKRSADTPATRTPSTAMKRLKRYLDSHLDQSISLGQMSRIANVSASHLSAEFRRLFGSAPVTYHIEQRMIHARYLLRERNMSVSEVANALGYPNIYQFSRMFKRTVGVSPTGFRDGG